MCSPRDISATNKEQGAWHKNVIPAATETAMHILRDAHVLGRFYLACGTGLALQFGHRFSFELNFFSPEHFNEDVLFERLQRLDGFSLVMKAHHTLHATIKNTKISFRGYAHPLLFPANPFLGVAVADSRDIACMKLSAIASRGTKRDFVDLYACAARYGLNAIFGLFDQKFAQARFRRIHILKSLTYFADTEKDPMPHMIAEVDWESVKQFFLWKAPRLL